MEYRKFGRTGKNLSVLGFGGTRFLDYASEEGQEKNIELLMKANDRGINYFDTAHDYCAGYSDLIYAKAFKRMKNPYYVSAKSRISYDPDEKSVRNRIEYYLRMFGIEKIHFFYMWCILNLEQYKIIMRPGGAYEGAEKAKQEGLIEHICFSAHCSGEDIISIINDGYYEGVILGYNILNYKYREKAIRKAKEKGLGVITMNSLTGGLIPQYYWSFPNFANKQDEAIEKALGFVIANKDITVALSGMKNERELFQNIATADKYSVGNYTDFVDRAKKDINLSSDDLCTGCRYCIGCPYGIGTDQLMQSYNLKILSGKIDKVLTDMEEKWFYPVSEKIECISCGLCEKRCTQHLPIRERIQKINAAIEEQNIQKQKFFTGLIGNTPIHRVGLYGIGGVAYKFIKDYETYVGEWSEFPQLFDKNETKWGDRPFKFESLVKSPEEMIGNIDRIVICNFNHADEVYEELKYLEEKGITIVKYDGKYVIKGVDKYEKSV